MSSSNLSIIDYYSNHSNYFKQYEIILIVNIMNFPPILRYEFAIVLETGNYILLLAKNCQAHMLSWIFRMFKFVLLMCPSYHIGHVSNLEIVVEFYLLLNTLHYCFGNVSLKKWLVGFLGQGLTAFYLDFPGNLFSVRK